MDQNRVADTVRQIERLTARPGQEPPAAETLHSAAAFMTQLADALAADGIDWPEPEIEVGGGGTVVFLWHQGQRFLSLVVGADGPGRWVCEPASYAGSVVNLDFNNRLSGGEADPAEFARSVWVPWARGEDPTAA